jgi:hypothetical protein
VSDPSIERHLLWDVKFSNEDQEVETCMPDCHAAHCAWRFFKPNAPRFTKGVIFRDPDEQQYNPGTIRTKNSKI